MRTFVGTARAGIYLDDYTGLYAVQVQDPNSSHEYYYTFDTFEEAEEWLDREQHEDFIND